MSEKSSSWKSFFGTCWSVTTDETQRSLSSANSPFSSNNLSLILAGSNLHAFTTAEITTMTRNLSNSNLVGEGGFGPVYKGFIPNKLRPGLEAQHVAVKILDQEGPQGHKEWLTEIVHLGQLRHPNLVKLIGYCCEDENRMLVYEFMQFGNLENHLFKSIDTLSWSNRLKIAVQAAKGLAFLHESEKPIIYRDFKPSNILLDSDYTVKLSDFGLAKEGPQGDASHVSTRVMGTHGYAAPEYILTGHLTAKSDVYSFGVVLLELLTGKQVVDMNRKSQWEQDLLEWARPSLKRPESLHKIMDPKLEYSPKVAQKAALVAYQCLNSVHKSRPRMREVVDELEPLLEIVDLPMGPFVITVQKEENCEKVRGVDGKVADEYERRENRKRRRGAISAVHDDGMLDYGDLRGYPTQQNHQYRHHRER